MKGIWYTMSELHENAKNEIFKPINTEVNYILLKRVNIKLFKTCMLS